MEYDTKICLEKERKKQDYKKRGIFIIVKKEEKTEKL